MCYRHYPRHFCTGFGSENGGGAPEDPACWNETGAYSDAASSESERVESAGNANRSKGTRILRAELEHVAVAVATGEIPPRKKRKKGRDKWRGGRVVSIQYGITFPAYSPRYTGGGEERRRPPASP